MRILAFERSWWRLAGAKERDILEVFGVPVTRYYQLLNELIDRPEAAEFDPVLVDEAAPAAQQAAADALRPAGLTSMAILPRADGPREGRAGLAALLAAPARALIALDFDGTLAPIVDDPTQARATAAAAAALHQLAGLAGTVAIITGRPGGRCRRVRRRCRRSRT